MQIRTVFLMACMLAACNGGRTAMPGDAGAETDPDPEEPDAGPPPPPATMAGRIRLVEVYYNTDRLWSISAGARFEWIEGMVQEVPIDSVGGCDIYQGNPHRGAPDPLDAGDMAVAGGSRDLQFTRLMTGGYTVDVPESPVDLFEPGQTLSLDAVGGADMPPFSAQTPGVGRVDVTEPDLSVDVSIARGAPLPVQWTGAEGAELHIEIKGGSISVACTVADAEGAAVIPAEALAFLPPGSGVFIANRFTRTELRAGDASIVFEAANIETGTATIE